MSRPAGLILAGGAGSRFGGVRKADLIVGGQRLLERQISALSAHCGPVMVSIGRSALSSCSAPSVADAEGEPQGPIGGYHAFADWHDRTTAAPNLVVTMAVDTPGLPADFVERLLSALAEGADAAFARCMEIDHPTHAAWTIDALKRALASGPKSPRNALALVGATPVDWAGETGVDPFGSINTVSELLAWQRRLRPPADMHRPAN